MPARLANQRRQMRSPDHLLSNGSRHSRQGRLLATWMRSGLGFDWFAIRENYRGLSQVPSEAHKTHHRVPGGGLWLPLRIGEVDGWDGRVRASASTPAADAPGTVCDFRT